MQESCLKYNRTSVTKNLFKFHWTNYMVPSLKLTLNLMHFPILLWNTPIYCWMDSSGMNISSIVTALLMALNAFKTTPSLWSSKIRGKEKFTWRKITWTEFFFFNSAIFFSCRNCRMSSTPSLVIFQTHIQGIIFQALSYVKSSLLVIIRTLDLTYLHDAFWRQFFPEVIFHLLVLWA